MALLALCSALEPLQPPEVASISRIPHLPWKPVSEHVNRGQLTPCLRRVTSCCQLLSFQNACTQPSRRAYQEESYYVPIQMPLTSDIA